MKLDSPSRFTSFYESFSDLIFATMAIFVLLMVIFLSLIKPTENVDAIKQELGQAKAELAEVQQALQESEFEKEKAREQLEEITKALTDIESAIQSQGLELIVVVDVSGSMSDALGHLEETIRTISKVLPKVAPEFRIGVVAYAISDKVPNGLQVFPAQQIFPEHKDGGRSLAMINSFIDKLVRGGLAPVDRAFLTALDMSEQSASQFEGSQTIMLLGDVGPYESPNGDWTRVEQYERQAERQLLQQISRWVGDRDKRSIISLYSGKPVNNRSSGKDQASYNFFRQVAVAADQPKNFTQNPGKMLAYLLTAIVKED